MNWFSLFAVILLVAQTPMPTTGKAANISTGNSPTQNQSADRSQNPSLPSVAARTKDSNGPTFKSDSDKDPDSNDQPTINITNPAPVPIPWGWHEHAIFWANLILAIVGIGGIVVAIFTLCFIKRQAVEMLRQRITMVKTLIVIKEQAKSLKQQNDMIMSKERARLRVDLGQLPKEPEDFPAFIVKALVTISGSTEAAIRNTAFKTMIVGPHQIPQLPTLQEMRGMPSVIRAADAPIEVRDFIVAIGGFPKVFTGASTVYAKGAIHYTDVFDGKWVFRFSRRYKYLFFPDSKIIGGGWENYGEEEDNGEYPDL
jgi:hypothetical protein